MRLGLIHRPLATLPRVGAAIASVLSPVAECNWHEAIPLDGDDLGNRDHGCCVPAAAFRGLQIRRAITAGDQRRPRTEEVLALYRRWADWDGTESTDLGTATDAAAAQWQADGIPWGENWTDVPDIYAFDPRNLAHLRAAIAYLGPVMLDLNLPLAWQNSGGFWIPAIGPAGEAGSWGAHRVCVGRYDQEWLYGISWGQEIQISPSVLAGYALHAEVPVSRSWLDTRGLSPAGLGLDGLQREGRTLNE